MRPRATAVVFVMVAAVIGCNLGGEDAGRLQRQAEAALSRWAGAVEASGGPSPVAPVGELTGQVGDWELEVGDNNKAALLAGLVDIADDMLDQPQPDGTVSWPDGTSASVPVLTGEEAALDIRRDSTADCDDCRPLRVTAARLVRGAFETSRGPAVGPVWEFTVEGTAVKVTRVAVGDAVTIHPLPVDPDDEPIGLSIDSATGSVGGRELTVTFVGATKTGREPCGSDYTTRAVESDLAVVVIVFEHPNVPLSGGCTLAGLERTAIVRLSAPLDERAVLDVQFGLPVRVRLEP